MASFYLQKSQSPTYYNLCLHLQEHGWKQTCFKWLAQFSEDNLKFDKEAAECLEYKNLLANLVAKYCPEVMPLTHCINDHNWPGVLSLIVDKQQEKFTWILKPALLNNGKHIKIFSHLNQIEDYFLNANRLGGEHVLQEYIMNPHLLKGPKAGHKYSIRMFVVLTNYSEPYFYPNGYFNIALNPYHPDDFSDLRAHLTNEHLSDEEYNVVQIPTFKYDFFKTLYPKIQAIVVEIIKALQQEFPYAFVYKKQHRLAIFGFDFVVDNSQKVWLIEANHGPCFPINDEHPLQTNFYANFWRDLISKVLV